MLDQCMSVLYERNPAKVDSVNMQRRSIDETILKHLSRFMNPAHAWPNQRLHREEATTQPLYCIHMDRLGTLHQ